jgi:Glu-tRNA(Gln) amidotransferase subunit E-like FAD-binding protein
VEKIELITRIRNLSELLHSDDLHKYSFSEETIAEMTQKLDEITEQYIAAYC